MNLIRRLLIPLLYRRGGSKQLQCYKFIEENQWNSIDVNTKIQKKLLYDMVKHSFSNIPYYRNLNIDISDFKEESIFEDIKRIPFLTREGVKQEFDNLNIKAQGIRKTFPNASGGSTGIPVRVMQDNYYFDWMMGAKILYDEWMGRKLGECQITLWGLPGDITNKKDSMGKRLAAWVRNVIELSAYKMSQQNIKDYISIINAKRPKVILAFSEAIYELAKYIKSNNIQIYSPYSIMTTAGILYPEHREFIENVFGCPVFNRYGSREVGDIACECEKHEGLHLSMFDHYIEIVNEQGETCKPGENGEIVVTTLRNYSMPLIRYKIGDVGALSDKECSCGRGLKILKEVAGRTTDMFRNANGDLVHGTFFVQLFFFKDYVRKYQVIQEKGNYFVIKLVLDNNQVFIDNKKDFEGIADKIRMRMGKNVEVEYRVVDDIEPAASGKYRYTISKVN